MYLEWRKDLMGKLSEGTFSQKNGRTLQLRRSSFLATRVIPAVEDTLTEWVIEPNNHGREETQINEMFQHDRRHFLQNIGGLVGVYHTNVSHCSGKKLKMFPYYLQIELKPPYTGKQNRVAFYKHESRDW